MNDFISREAVWEMIEKAHIISSGSWQCVRKYTDKGRENEYSYLHRLEYDNPNKYEVIGNVFDNPELLKGK